MEWINEFILINTGSANEPNETSCVIARTEAWVNIRYTLGQNDCLFQFPAHQTHIELQIAASYFEKYNEDINLFVEKQSICCNTQSKLFDLVHCNLTGFARKLFLESTVLYLVYQVFKNNLVFGLNCDTCSFLNRPLEVEKIQLAKQYIVTHLDANITIPNIATQVGTNSCYLKKAFKEVVGQTIFEFVQENRMVRAKHLIEQTNQSMGEIAFEVGYSSLSSFSQAYKNYFGISPLKQAKA
jgi:AraC-like DNA-binding protein